MSLQFKRLEIPDVQLVTPTVRGDDRGFFIESFKASEMAAAGMPSEFMQDNQSHSSKNILRGLHYQLDPKAQGKFVRVVAGEIFDVCVDLRKSSKWFGKWVGARLSDSNFQMLYVPPGFAHGFVVISDVAEVLYKCTLEYSPTLERGIRWNDPELAIEWPVKSPLLSARDLAHPLFRDAEYNFS